MSAILYEFAASGQDEVRRAFETTAASEEKAAAAHLRAQRKTTESVAAQVKAVQRAQTEGAKSAARNQVREYEAQQKASAAAKVQEEKRLAASDRARQKEAQQQERVRDKETQQRDRKAAKDAQQQERSRQREAQQHDRALQRETKAKEREANAWNKAKQKAVDRAMAAETRAAEKTAKEQSRIVARQQQQQQVAWQKYEKERLAEKKKIQDSQAAAHDAGGSKGMSAWDIAKGTMIGGFAARGAMAAVDIVKDAGRAVAELQESANRTSISARQAGQEFVDPASLIRDVQAAALGSPGQKASDIMQALQGFVSLTGELKTGRESAGTFATVASATGSSVGDVSQAAASIYNQFGLKTKEEMQDVLASLTFQGKTGAFELKDAASQFQRLAAAGASFGLSGAKGVKTIGGLAQIARTGTGSAEQTTTAIENIFSNLIAKSSILKQEGVKVYDKTGKTRDVTDVLLESIVKAGKNNFEKKGQILQKVFGDQGIRGVRPLLAKYQTEFQGVRNKGGTEAEAAAAGLKRLREEIDKSVNAPGAWAEVQKDAAQAAKDPSAQLTKSYEALQASLTKTALPALAAFAVAMEGVVKYLTDKGILKGAEDDVDVKRNRQTVDQMKARSEELLSKGPMTPEDAEEFGVLQDQLAKSELRNTSDDDLRKQKDALYGKGGVMSEDDAAAADRLQAEIKRRENPDVGAFKSLTNDEFVQDYAAGTKGDVSVAKARAKIAAAGAENGVDIPDWMFVGLGESDASYESRQRYKEQIKGAKKPEGSPDMSVPETLGYGWLTGGSSVGKTQGESVPMDARELSAAATDLKAAAKSLQAASPQASITGTTGPSTAPGS